jgi:hypothetical protein
MEATSIVNLLKKIKNNKELEKEFKNDPIGFLERIEEPPMNDKVVFLTIVAIVGLVLLGTVVLASLIIFQAPDNQTAKVPEFLVGIGSTALGALVGLLAPTPRTIE